MRLPNILFAFLLAGGLVMLAPIVAQAGPAEDSFSQGVKSANTGDYQVALDAFLRAQSQGMKKPTLDYNLAVAYYRLGRYSEARKVFTRLAREPQFTHMAYFNLGLIANKTGDERSAIDWFMRTYRNTPNEKLKALSARALKRLGIDAEREASSKKWGGFAAINAGYDSNVRLANEDLIGVANEGDYSYEVMAVGNYWLSGGRNGGVRLSLTADVQKYQTFSSYDFSQFNLGLVHLGQLGGWNTRVTGAWNESYLGGNNYQRTFAGEMRGRYAMGTDKYLRLRYRLNYISSSDALYEALDGWRHQLRAGMQVNKGVHRYRAYYQLDLNDRNDRLNGTQFTSFSPTRHAFRALADFRLGASWKARLDARYRYSGYNDPSDLTGGGSITRVDKQLKLGARLGLNFAKYWEVEGQYNYYDNSSNIAIDSYKRTVTYIGINRFF